MDPSPSQTLAEPTASASTPTPPSSHQPAPSASAKHVWQREIPLRCYTSGSHKIPHHGGYCRLFWITWPLTRNKWYLSWERREHTMVEGCRTVRSLVLVWSKIRLSSIIGIIAKNQQTVSGPGFDARFFQLRWTFCIYWTYSISDTKNTHFHLH